MRVTLLGPQRRPTVDTILAGIDRQDGHLATLTAGWQERESEDQELHGLLGDRTVNLGLYRRWLDVQERDREFAVAELDHRAVLAELHQLYLVQLDHALGTVFALAAREGRPRVKAAACADAEAVVRLVDERHRERTREAHASFYAAWRPEERPVIAEHREAVQRLLNDAAALVIAGGHVGVLLQVLHIFHVAPRLPDVVVAWSAGAMALTERVVLFHDWAPQGSEHPELYDDGIGLVRDLVLLPHARRRLRVDDHARMSVLARRFAPARCVVLDDGVRVDLDAGGALPESARVIGADGRIVAVEAA